MRKEDKIFVARRRTVLERWCWGRVVCLFAIAGSWGWLWASSPGLMNPVVALERLGEQADGDTVLISLIAVVLMHLSFLLLLVLLGFLEIAMRFERRWSRVLMEVMRLAYGESHDE